MPTQTQYTTVTAKAAKAAAYEPLTYEYLPREYPMMQAAIRTLGSAPHVLVAETDTPNNIAVWRKGYTS